MAGMLVPPPLPFFWLMFVFILWLNHRFFTDMNHVSTLFFGLMFVVVSSVIARSAEAAVSG